MVALSGCDGKDQNLRGKTGLSLNLEEKREARRARSRRELEGLIEQGKKERC